MNTESSKLIKFVAINSYLDTKDKILEIDLCGSTVILGKNTKGKTSTLRPVIMFYGFPPGRLGKHEGKKMAPFYFPTSSSFMVFEYLKNNEPKMVVMSSSDKYSVEYRFISGQYSEELFVQTNSDGEKFFIDESDLRASCIRKNRKVSAKMGPSQYAEVILSGMRNRAKPELFNLRRDWSLCGLGETIEGVENILFSILSSKPSFSTVKNLIAQQVYRDVNGLDEILKTSINDVDNFERRIELIRSGDKFLEKRNLLVELKAALDGHKDSILNLRYCFFESSNLMDSLIDKENEIRDEKVNLEEDFKAVRGEFETSSKDINTKIGRLESAIGNSTSDIENIEKTYEEYRSKNIEKDGEDSRSLDSIIDDLSNLKKQEDSLSSSLKEVLEKFKEDELKIKDSTSKSISYERAINEEKLDSIREDLENINKFSSQIEDNIRSKYESKINTLSEQITAHGSKGAETEAQLKNPDSKKLVELNSSRESLLGSIQNLNSEKGDLHLDERAIISELEKAEKELSRFNAVITKIQEDKGTEDDLIKKHTHELKKVESMLYFKLANADIERAELASRVLTEEVLKSKYEGEVLPGTNGNGLFGLDINFQLFDSKKPSDKYKLEECVKRSTQVKVGLEKELLQKSEDRKKSEILVKKLKERTVNVQSEILSKQGKITSITTQRTKVETEIKVEQRNLKVQLGQKLEEINKYQNELISQRSNLSLGQKSSIKSEKDKSKNDKALKKSEIIATKESLITFTFNVNKKMKEGIEWLEKAKSDMMKEKGVPESVFLDVKNKIKETSETVEIAKDAKVRYEKYMTWYQNRYERLPSIRATLKEDKDSLCRLEVELEEINSNFSKCKSGHMEEIESKTSESVLMHKDIEVLMSINNGLELLYEPKEDHSGQAVHSVSQLTLKIKGHKEDLNTANKLGKEVYIKIKSSLNSHPALKMFVMKSAIESTITIDTHSSDEWHKTYQFIYRLFSLIEHSLKTEKKQVDISADQILDLESRLDGLHASLTSDARKIRKATEEMAEKFPVMSEISINVKSTIGESVFMNELKKACNIISISKRGGEMDKSYDSILSAMRVLKRDSSIIEVDNMIELSVTAVDNSISRNKTVARTDKELAKISSEGMSFMILCMIFISLKKAWTKSTNVGMTWAIDELGRIHGDNAKKLKEIFEEENVFMFGAQPEATLKAQSIFDNIYEIRNGGFRKIDAGKSHEKAMERILSILDGE